MKKAKYYKKEELKNQIEDLLDDKLYTIVAQVKHRTIPQNKLLHVYFHIISDRMNEIWDEITPEYLKIVLKQRMWKTFERKGVKYTKPTSEYSTVEINEFIDSMKIFCKDCLDFQLPDPGDRRLLDYYNNHLR